MAAARNARKVRQGLVMSNKMQDTVVVKIERRVQHPLYGKTVLKSERFAAHVDGKALNSEKVDVGDTVEIMETRPISKTKRWRVTRIIEKVK